MSERVIALTVSLGFAFLQAFAARYGAANEMWGLVWTATGLCLFQIVWGVGVLVLVADKPELEPKPSPYKDCIIRIRAESDRASLRSVVYYVQPEAAPDWTFHDCTFWGTA